MKWLPAFVLGLGCMLPVAAGFDVHMQVPRFAETSATIASDDAKSGIVATVAPVDSFECRNCAEGIYHEQEVHYWVGASECGGGGGTLASSPNPADDYLSVLESMAAVGSLLATSGEVSSPDQNREETQVANFATTETRTNVVPARVETPGCRLCNLDEDYCDDPGVPHAGDCPLDPCGIGGGLLVSWEEILDLVEQAEQGPPDLTGGSTALQELAQFLGFDDRYGLDLQRSAIQAYDCNGNVRLHAVVSESMAGALRNALASANSTAVLRDRQ